MKNQCWYSIISSRYELLFNTPKYIFWSKSFDVSLQNYNKDFEEEVSFFHYHAAVKVLDDDIDVKVHQYNPENTFNLMIFDSGVKKQHKVEDLIFIKEKLWCRYSELFPDVLTNHFHLIRGNDIGENVPPNRSHVWTDGEELAQLVRKINSGDAFVNLLYVSSSLQKINELEEILK